MGEKVTVARLPDCAFCSMKGKSTAAAYDFRTTFGAWANGCERHWTKYRATTKLGTGHGQKLVLDNAEALAEVGSGARGW